MSSCFPQPFWAARSPRTQEFLWDFILRTLRASGTTILFFWSYGYGIPSKTLNLSRAALPLGDLCGNIPLRLLQNILDGDLKCLKFLLGLVLFAFLRKSWKLMLFLNKDPLKRSCSHLTTTTL